MTGATDRTSPAGFAQHNFPDGNSHFAIFVSSFCGAAKVES